MSLMNNLLCIKTHMLTITLQTYDIMSIMLECELNHDKNLPIIMNIWPCLHIFTAVSPINFIMHNNNCIKDVCANMHTLLQEYDL